VEERTKGDGVDVLIEDKGERDREIENIESLGTNVIRQDFKRVCHN
jgi:hypothetical protein